MNIIQFIASKRENFHKFITSIDLGNASHNNVLRAHATKLLEAPIEFFVEYIATAIKENKTPTQMLNEIVDRLYDKAAADIHSKISDDHRLVFNRYFDMFLDLVRTMNK